MSKQKRKYLLIALFSIFSAINSFAQSIDAISKEMIEYELAGARWQGGESPCLEQSHFKLIKAPHQSLGDASLLHPTYSLPKGTAVSIISSHVSVLDTVEVTFSYEILVAGKPVKIEDSLTYILNLGARLKRLGVASIYMEPKFFAMREECLISEANKH